MPQKTETEHRFCSEGCGDDIDDLSTNRTVCDNCRPNMKRVTCPHCDTIDAHDTVDGLYCPNCDE